MKKVCFCLIGLLVIAGCKETTDTIICDKYTIEFQQSDNTDKLDIVINGDAVTLEHMVSASGALFGGILNDTNVQLWNKGRQWTLFLNDDTPISCK